MNITDEGIQKLSYSLMGSDNPLSPFQQSMLRTAAKVQFFEDDFLEKFIDNIAGGNAVKVGTALSKLQKRLISQISPRNVSFTGDDISDALAKMGPKAQFVKSYDQTDLLLRVAAGEELTGLDALLMSKTGGDIS